MIKRLKRKFIIINMFSVLLVMFIAFYCNYSFNQANMYTESINGMEKAINDGSPKTMQTFLVFVNNYDKIYQVRGYKGSLTEDFKDVSIFTITALSAKNDIGDIKGTNLRFLKKNTPDGTVIAFTSTVDETLALEGIIRFSTYIFICCALVFFGISVYLANIATEPVEESLERRKQFIADASHELKTPLTAIMTSAEVLLDSNEINGEDRGWIKGIRESAEDMSVLVNDMLNLARTEDDTVKRIEENVDLSELTMTLALDYEYILFEAGKTFSIDVDSNITVFGNSGELKQLIKIFLDNAKKYSYDNGIIKLSLKNFQDKAVLTVFNTGDPIPNDEIEKIFERFYRVDKVRSGASGYGLGLSIAKNIADNHLTKIHVNSDSYGTSFSVALKTVK